MPQNITIFKSSLTFSPVCFQTEIKVIKIPQTLIICPSKCYSFVESHVTYFINLKNRNYRALKVVSEYKSKLYISWKKPSYLVKDNVTCTNFCVGAPSMSHRACVQFRFLLLKFTYTSSKRTLRCGKNTLFAFPLKFDSWYVEELKFRQFPLSRWHFGPPRCARYNNYGWFAARHIWVGLAKLANTSARRQRSWEGDNTWSEGDVSTVRARLCQNSRRVRDNSCHYGCIWCSW